MKTMVTVRASGSSCRRIAMAPQLAVLCLVFAHLFFGCNRIDPAAAPSPAAKSLTVFTYPNYLPAEVLQAFESATGIAVQYLTFETMDELRHKVVSNPGAYDVLIAEGGRIAVEFRQLKLIQPFQTRKLSGLNQLDPRFGVFNPETLRVLSVPYLWGSTLIAYRTDKLQLQEEEKTWSIFWNQRVRERAALIEEPVDAFAVGLGSLGLPFHSQNRADNQRAEAHLRAAIENNGVRLGDCWTNLDRLTSGEYWLTQCYSGDAAMLATEHENIGYFMPREGAPLWVDGFMLCSDSTRVEEAHEFVTFMLRPAVAARCAGYCLQLTPNRNAQSLLDPLLMANKTLNPSAELLDRCSLMPAIDGRELAGTLQLGMRNLQETAHALELKRAASAPQPATSTTPLLTAGDPPDNPR